jgi:hypothetical protein
VLLPAPVHVSLFTAVFMTLGAACSRSPAQLALVFTSGESFAQRACKCA